jgi:hypothetical protein
MAPIFKLVLRLQRELLDEAIVKAVEIVVNIRNKGKGQEAPAPEKS